MVVIKTIINKIIIYPNYDDGKGFDDIIITTKTKFIIFFNNSITNQFQ